MVLEAAWLCLRRGAGRGLAPADIVFALLPGAMLAVLCAGVRKNELIALDVGDLREVDGALGLSIRRTRQPSRAKQRLVLLGAETSALLRRYWVHERLAHQPS